MKPLPSNDETRALAAIPTNNPDRLLGYNKNGRG